MAGSMRSKVGTADYLHPDERLRRQRAAKKKRGKAAAGTLKSSNVSAASSRKAQTDEDVASLMRQLRRRGRP